MNTTPINTPNSIEILTTDDGSHTLLNKHLEEPYHSTFGAIQESKHLFLNHGWEHLKNHTGPATVFEVGLGTGLNALLTAIKAKEEQRKILYASLEKTPLPESIWKQLNYPVLLTSENHSKPSISKLFNLIHQVKWESVQPLSPWFQIFKKQGDVTNFTIPEMQFDIIYFDAFGPEVQPSLWSETVFRKMHQLLKNPGLLITYSCKGTVKRNLKTVGFVLEKIPGPPGKRECLRAWKR